MSDAEFYAYVEGLPAQDRRTVEQALRGLRSALNRVPRAEAEVLGRDGVSSLLRALRDIGRRQRPPAAQPARRLVRAACSSHSALGRRSPKRS